MANGGVQCLHCGDIHKLPAPMPVTDMSNLLTGFSDRHAKCKKVWQPPSIDIGYSLPERIKWWLNIGEQGSSSISIYNVMMPGYNIYGTNRRDYPYDADDFRRCYLLLKVIPEWKERLVLMSSVSEQWRKLVKNWDKLTGMLENAMTSTGGDYTEIHAFLKQLLGS